MKVLHLIAGNDAGGAKTHLLNLLSQLQKSDTVTLACLGDGVLAREAGARGVDVRVVSGGFRAGLRAVKELAGAADVLHCHGSRANLTGALAKGELGCPVLSTIHSDHRLDYLGRPLARLSYGALNGWALRQMDGLVCVSKAMQELYARRGFDPERLHHIYNGVDFDRPTVELDRQRWFESLGFAVAPGDVVIGAAGRFHPVKDFSTLLRGFARAAEAAPELKLVLAGAGAEEERLRALAKELGMESRVCFPGWLGDMESFYAAVDVTALSSKSETFPYALTEGARYRKPAVATAVGGVPELIDQGVSGFLYPVGDADALAEALLRLTDDELRRSMGQALWERASRDFTLAAAGETQRRIYLSVLGEN